MAGGLEDNVSFLSQDAGSVPEKLLADNNRIFKGLPAQDPPPVILRQKIFSLGFFIYTECVS